MRSEVLVSVDVHVNFLRGVTVVLSVLTGTKVVCKRSGLAEVN